jgi:cytochrome c553
MLGLGWPNLGVGADINRGEAVFKAECAGCHGPGAWGGKDGQYPRLAGLPAGYLQRQLESFRERRRQNKPMIPIFKAGRLRREDVTAVAAYLAALPPPDPDQLGAPTAAVYDRVLGGALYTQGCARCHGADGNGVPGTENPPVTRQHPAYLVKQLRDFRSGIRDHEDAAALFQDARPEALDALLGYTLDLNNRVPDSSRP